MHVVLTRFEEQDSYLTQVEVDEVLGLVGHITTEEKRMGHFHIWEYTDWSYEKQNESFAKKLGYKRLALQ